jgi:acylphosphatase
MPDSEPTGVNGIAERLEKKRSMIERRPDSRDGRLSRIYPHSPDDGMSSRPPSCARLMPSRERTSSRGRGGRHVHRVRHAPSARIARTDLIFADQLAVASREAHLQNWRSMVLHFLIRGRVQGVGFRWFVHREASELDLHGWVRNTEDGDVEVVASGSVEDLAELRSSLRRGPRGARVDQLIEHYLDEKEAANLTAFRIEGAW